MVLEEKEKRKLSELSIIFTSMLYVEEGNIQLKMIELKLYRENRSKETKRFKKPRYLNDTVSLI